MAKYYKKLFTAFLLILAFTSFSQSNSKVDSNDNIKLFADTSLLPVRLKYSRKQIKKETNDSTYMNSQLSYLTTVNNWETISIKLRARGNFRKKTCFFTPLKMKIKKDNSEGTVFEGEKRLKVVLPCLNESQKK